MGGAQLWWECKAAQRTSEPTPPLTSTPPCPGQRHSSPGSHRCARHQSWKAAPPQNAPPSNQPTVLMVQQRVMRLGGWTIVSPSRLHPPTHPPTHPAIRPSAHASAPAPSAPPQPRTAPVTADLPKDAAVRIAFSNCASFREAPSKAVL